MMTGSGIWWAYDSILLHYADLCPPFSILSLLYWSISDLGNGQMFLAPRPCGMKRTCHLVLRHPYVTKQLIASKNAHLFLFASF